MNDFYGNSGAVDTEKKSLSQGCQALIAFLILLIAIAFLYVLERTGEITAQKADDIFPLVLVLMVVDFVFLCKCLMVSVRRFLSRVEFF